MGILFGKRKSASISDKVKMVFTDAKAFEEREKMPCALLRRA